MAYDPTVPPSLISQGIGGPTGLRWFALTWIDPIADVLEPGYIENARDVGLRPGDGLIYKDVNRGEWDRYDLIVQSIDDDGAATVAFPEVPEEALPQASVSDEDSNNIQLVGYLNGRQSRLLFGDYTATADYTAEGVQEAVLSDFRNTVRTSGFHEPGDGGDALYKRELTDPGTRDSIEVTFGSPPVQRWLRRIHEGEGVDLMQHGLYGDARTNSLRDDTARFLDAIALASDLGVYKVVGRGGKQFRVVNALIDGGVHVPIGGQIEIDLGGGTLYGSRNEGASNGSIRMLTTEQADNISVILRNGEVDGGYTSIGTSGYGERSIFLRGGAVEFHDLVLHGTSNRAPYSVPEPYSVTDPVAYPAGEVVILNADRFVMHNTKWRSMAGEGLIVMSDDARTVVSAFNNRFTKRRDSDGSVLSNTPVNIFNVNPASVLRDTWIKDCLKSAMNLLTNGLTVDGIYIENVADSSGIDLSESTKLANSQFVLRNGRLKNIGAGAGAPIRASAPSIIIENFDIDILPGKYGMLFDATTVGFAAWSDPWLPPAGQYELQIRLKQIRTSGAGAAAVRVNGSSAEKPSFLDVDTLYWNGSGSKSSYAVDASHTHVTMRGKVDEGSIANVRLTVGGSATLDKCAYSPPASGHGVLLQSVSADTEVHFRDSRRAVPLSGGFDVRLGGTTSTAVRAFVDGRIDPTLAAISLSSASMPLLVRGEYRGSLLYNPTGIGAGGRITRAVSVPGAAMGEPAQAAFSIDLGGLIIESAVVTAANTVTVTFYNPTGATIDLGEGTLYCTVKAKQ